MAMNLVPLMHPTRVLREAGTYTVDEGLAADTSLAIDAAHSSSWVLQ